MTSVFFTIEGLGLLCFNPDKNRGEIAIIRQGEHNLKIVVAKDGDAGPPVYIFEHDKIPAGATIDVKTENPALKSFIMLKEDDFNRKSGLGGTNDEKDLQWLLDLEGDELHGKKLAPLSTLGTDIAVAKMYVPNGLFFTATLATDGVSYLKKANEAQMHHLGVVGDSLGIAISADKITLEITDNESLTLDDGGQYNITIKNLEPIDPKAPPESDFPVYYEVLSPGEDDTFEIITFKKDLLTGFPSLAPGMECFVALMSKTTTIDDIPV